MVLDAFRRRPAPPCWCCALWGLHVPGTVPNTQGGPLMAFGRRIRGRMCQTCADAVTVQADADRHLAEERRRG